MTRRRSKAGEPGDPQNGEYTQAETARVLGVDVRHVRRIERAAIAKFVARVSELEHADIGKVRALLSIKNLSTANAGISERACPGDPASAAGSEHAPRAATTPLADGAHPVERRAGLLSPRKERTMKIDSKLTCAISDLRARVNVSDADVSKLLAAAGASDYERFQSELRRIEATAPAHTAATEPDAFALHGSNPHLASAMKFAGITADDVKKFGPRGQLADRVLPELAELAEATAARVG